MQAACASFAAPIMTMFGSVESVGPWSCQVLGGHVHGHLLIGEAKEITSGIGAPLR
jgi:hypothetical protein